MMDISENRRKGYNAAVVAAAAAMGLGLCGPAVADMVPTAPGPDTHVHLDASRMARAIVFQLHTYLPPQ